VNDAYLLESVRDPNSNDSVFVRADDSRHEHVSEGHGASTLQQQSRLGGAEAHHAAGTWEEMRAFITGKLRTDASAGFTDDERLRRRRDGDERLRLGAYADEVLLDEKGDGGKVCAKQFTYEGLPVALLPPVRRGWHMLDPPEFGALRSGEWVLAYTHDPTEFGTLKWRLLEEETREALDAAIGAHCSVADYREGQRMVVWQVQCAAAEMCAPDAAHAHAWVRWVAVLRGGGTPPVVAGRPTNAKQEVEWAVEADLEATMAQRLRDSMHLDVVAGTPPTANLRMLVFSTHLSDWSHRRVTTSPAWPREWVADHAAGGCAQPPLDPSPRRPHTQTRTPPPAPSPPTPRARRPRRDGGLLRRELDRLDGRPREGRARY
jgi:hypothetical protein